MPHLYYIHDPMCSWCWGFRPVLDELLQRLPSDLSHSRLLGGLAPDSDQPMPESLREELQAIWRRIQETLPGTRFNFDFWSRNVPRRSTYPACRAVIAARELQPAREDAMILAIQQAYYLQARNPSDDSTLIDLAAGIGLDPGAFRARLHAPETGDQLEREILQARQMGIHSFPSLALHKADRLWPVAVDYHSADPMLESLQMMLA